MALIYNFLSEDSGLITKTVNGFLPQTAIIPLKKNTDDDVTILVKAGDSVKEGQVIASAKDTNIHASIPGIVKDIVHTKFADGSEGYAAKIELGGSLSFTGKKLKETNWSSMSSSSLLYAFKENGILNTFGNPVPLNRQISELNHDSARILAVRLYSEDPSELTEGFLTDNYLEKIKTGSFIIAKAMDAKGIVFVYDNNKDVPDFSIPGCPIEIGSAGINAKSYPNGFMHEIADVVKTTLKDSFFKKIGNRDLFIDVQTAINVYNGVVLNKPVIDTTVHVTGDCLNAAAIMNVKIGMTLGQIAKQCGDFKRKTGKIIVNGVITGLSLDSFDIPVSKEVKSVAFVPFDQLPDQEEEFCTRCGNCLNVCPLGLYPESLFRCYVNKDHIDDHYSLIKQTAVLCTECGLCNSVCPSRIPLSQIIAELKQVKVNEE